VQQTAQHECSRCRAIAPAIHAYLTQTAAKPEPLNWARSKSMTGKPPGICAAA